MTAYLLILIAVAPGLTVRKLTPIEYIDQAACEMAMPVITRGLADARNETWIGVCVPKPAAP